MGMSEELDVVSMSVKHKGIFDMTELYQNIKTWLDYKGFGDHENSFREQKYTERIQGEDKQLEIKWKAEKIINSYFSHIIEITFFVTGLKSIEIEEEGKKIGTNVGNIVIKFKAKVVLDRQGKWNSFFKSIYDKFIIRERIEENQNELYGKIYSLYNEVKTYLNMHNT